MWGYPANSGSKLQLWGEFARSAAILLAHQAQRF